MQTVIGVRFKKSGRVYYFNPGTLEIEQGDSVIVETAQGVEFADVAHGRIEIPDEQVIAPLRDVLRVATEADHEARRRSEGMRENAFNICQEKIRHHGLEMKLIDVEITFNGSKIIFYFTADGRIDFRELVKDLAYVFKTRIELRQIGVRDEAKMLGGLGSCGRPVCCKTFLNEFQPVSIKMAKEQNLSLSPTKISGLCGRLMCCLKYEQSDYEQMRKVMPRTGKEVFTPDGPGIVLDNNAITEKTKVRIQLPDGTPEIREYRFSDVHRPQPGEVYVPPAREEAPEGEQLSEKELAVARAQQAYARNHARNQRGNRKPLLPAPTQRQALAAPKQHPAIAAPQDAGQEQKPQQGHRDHKPHHRPHAPKQQAASGQPAGEQDAANTRPRRRGGRRRGGAHKPAAQHTES